MIDNLHAVLSRKMETKLKALYVKFHQNQMAELLFEAEVTSILKTEVNTDSFNELRFNRICNHQKDFKQRCDLLL